MGGKHGQPDHCKLCWKPYVNSGKKARRYCAECVDLLDQIQQRRARYQAPARCNPLTVERYLEIWGRD